MAVFPVKRVPWLVPTGWGAKFKLMNKLLLPVMSLLNMGYKPLAVRMRGGIGSGNDKEVSESVYTGLVEP